jgi:hypothetical protein
MPAPSPGPKYWLLRAEEARVVADQMQQHEVRLSLFQIALIYMRLALRASDNPGNETSGIACGRARDCIPSDADIRHESTVRSPSAKTAAL